MTKYCLVHNPSAGNQNLIEELHSSLNKLGPDVKFIQLQRGWQKKVKYQIKAGCLTVIAAGGDGTIREVAKLLVNRDLRLGVLPLGTYNHLAKDLNIPTQLDKAVDLIKNGKATSIDTASVNNHLFLNNSAVGLYPKLISQRPQTGGVFMKLIASTIGAFKVLRSLRPYHIQLSIDGATPQKNRASFIFIGNNDYQPDRIGFSNRTSLESGMLYLYRVKSARAFKIIWLFIKTLLGKAGEQDGFKHQTAKDVHIDFRQSKVRVSLDGELRQLKTPLHYKIYPKSLRVIQPR